MAFLDLFQRKLSWHYLNGIWGDGLWGLLADVLDDGLASAKQGVKQRFLEPCLDEALPYLAQTFGLTYPARFNPGTVRAYIGNVWTHWEDAGS